MFNPKKYNDHGDVVKCNGVAILFISRTQKATADKLKKSANMQKGHAIVDKEKKSFKDNYSPDEGWPMNISDEDKNKILTKAWIEHKRKDDVKKNDVKSLKRKKRTNDFIEGDGNVKLKSKKPIETYLNNLVKAKDLEFVKLKIKEGKEVSGVDFGRVNVVGAAVGKVINDNDMVEEDSANINGNDNSLLDDSFALSCKKIYEQSGVLDTNREGQKERDAAYALKGDYYDTLEKLKKLGKNPPASIKGQLNYSKTRVESFKAMNKVSGSKSRRVARIKNRHSMTVQYNFLVNRVVPNPNGILAVGDAGISGVGLSGKFLSFFKRMRGDKYVVEVDEFRTSCLDSQTFEIMYNPPKQRKKEGEREYLSKKRCVGGKKRKPKDYGERYVKKVYGLYVYKGNKNIEGPKGRPRVWNRDVNAAINIRHLFLYWLEHGRYPEEFTRGTEIKDRGAYKYKVKKRVMEKNEKLGGGFKRRNNGKWVLQPYKKIKRGGIMRMRKVMRKRMRKVK